MEQRKWGLSPEIQWEELQRERESKRKKEESRKKYIQKLKVEAKRKKKIKIETMFTIIFVAATMAGLLTRSAEVFQIQNRYNTIVNETKITHKENEALRANIMKKDNIVMLMEKAKTLPLVHISDDNSLIVDLSKNNFSDIPDEVDKSWKDNISDTIKEWKQKLL